MNRWLAFEDNFPDAILLDDFVRTMHLNSPNRIRYIGQNFSTVIFNGVQM
jgi:hypothetical protein